MASEDTQSTKPEASATPLHVLHVANCDIFDRFGQMPRHLALALNAEGLRVSLLTDDPVAAANLEGTPIGCYLVRVLSGWPAWRLGRELSRRFAPLPDLVHLWGTTDLHPVSDWAQRCGVPVLVSALSIKDVEQICRRGTRNDIQVVVGSRGFLDLLDRQSIALAANTPVCLPALLIPELPVERCTDDKHTLGVIWTGQFIEDAGLETLVDAIAGLRRKDCDLQVVLVGAGPSAQTMQERIRAAGVQSCVSLIDEPDLWEKAMGGADVCVVPARQAVLSLAPLLAMALGKIVVASRDQIAEWFIEDQTCWQFTPGSAVELAYHLTRVADNDRHAGELRQSATTYVRKHHSISRLVSDLVAIYQRIAQREPDNHQQ